MQKYYWWDAESHKIATHSVTNTFHYTKFTCEAGWNFRFHNIRFLWGTDQTGAIMCKDQPSNDRYCYAYNRSFLSLGHRRMRRSGAPSQLLGNAVKKPRFVPPGASTSFSVADSKPLTPNLGLGNVLDKVSLEILSIYDPDFRFLLYFAPHFLILWILFPLYLILQIQRSLAAPAASNITEGNVQPKAPPALSKALARVLSATESKENEDEAGHQNPGLGDFAEDCKAAGKKHAYLLFVLPSFFLASSPHFLVPLTWNVNRGGEGDTQEGRSRGNGALTKWDSLDLEP